MKLANFFILCSGASKEILQQCPTERVKFVGIGATVFFTGVLASLSGGYAIYFTFNSIPVAITIGLFWGIVIFSLDRYIVSSIRKSGNLKSELSMAFPRMIMAVVLAIVVAKPLELRLFNDAITKQMGEIARFSISKCEEDFNTTRDQLASRKSELEDELNQKKEDIYIKDKVYSDLLKDKILLEAENKKCQAKIDSNNKVIANGWVPPQVINGVKIKGYHNREAQRAINNNIPVKKQLSSNSNKLEKINSDIELRKASLLSQVGSTEQQYAQQIAGVQQQINAHNSARERTLNRCEEDANNARDIPARLEALSVLSQKNRTIKRASLMITLLFVILETAPVVVKLLSKRGPYDEILGRIEYEHLLEQQKIISDRNDEVNNLLHEIKELNKLKGEVRLRTEKAKLDAEMKANETILTDIASKQAELAQIAIAKWYEEQKKKMEANNQQVQSTL